MVKISLYDDLEINESDHIINLHALLGGTGENRGEPGIIAKKAYTSGKNTTFLGHISLVNAINMTFS